MSKLDGISRQFTDQHPEVGEIGKGVTMTAEKAEAMADVFDRKISALSRKGSLTFEEGRFLDRTADLGARNILYALKVHGIGVPDDVARNLIAKADALTGNAVGRRGPAPAGEITDDAIERALTGVTSGAAGATIAEKPYLRPNVEDFASAAVTGFADMVRDYSGSRLGAELTVDAYMAGNLQNMTANYEMAEAAGAAEFAGEVAAAGAGATRQ